MVQLLLHARRPSSTELCCWSPVLCLQPGVCCSAGVERAPRIGAAVDRQLAGGPAGQLGSARLGKCFAKYCHLDVLLRRASNAPRAAALTVEHNLPGFGRVRCRRRREPGWSEGAPMVGCPEQRAADGRDCVTV